MLSSLINALTAPSETFEKIANDYNWKQAMVPMLLVTFFALSSSILLYDQIIDLQASQIEQNNRMTDEARIQAKTILNSPIYKVFILISRVIDPPKRIFFWSLFSMLIGNLFLGSKSQFGKVFTVVSFSYLPSVIENLVKTPIQYISDNMMIFTGLGALGIGEQGDFIYSLLVRIDIFDMWRVYLTAIGFTFLYNVKQNDTLKALGSLWLAGILIFSAYEALIT